LTTIRTIELNLFGKRGILRGCGALGLAGTDEEAESRKCKMHNEEGARHHEDFEWQQISCDA
jgi:hypothetical protein